MHRSPFRRFIAPLARRCRFRRPGLGTAIFGARASRSPLPFRRSSSRTKPISAATGRRRRADEAAFLKENEAAMTKMMNDMAAKPSGDIDRDFVAMMTPHHQGAIDMAVIELRYGKNEHASAHRAGDHRRPDAGDRRHEARDRRAGCRPPRRRRRSQPPAPADSHHQHTGMHMDMSTGMKK